MENIKEKISTYTPQILAALLFIQPLLDVLSYFMRSLEATAVTTTIRTVLLFAVGAYGFLLSEKKRAYFVFLGIAGGFWLAHMLNCLRLGYANPVADTGEYLKLIQLPLWTLCFTTFFRQVPRLREHSTGLLAVNFALILAVILLSYLTRTPEYTYAGIQIGILGWFAVPTAQSAIVSLLAIGLLLWASRTGRFWIFCGAVLLGLGLLYATGTRLAYYSAILIALGFLVLFLLSRGKLLFFCIPLVMAILFLFLFRNGSPMAQRRAAAQDSYEIYQAQTDEIMGDDKDFTYTGGSVPEDVEKKIRRVYEEVYTQKNIAGTPLLGDLLDRFGTERVMEAYRYSTRADVLYHTRTKKLKVMELVWAEQDVATKVLGFEFAHSEINGNTYDPENDFPALVYYYGWLGIGLYCGFLGFFPLSILAKLFRRLRRLSDFLTLELGAYTMMFCLGLGAAQFSGNVIRRPSVTVYLSFAAAQIIQELFQDSGKRIFARYERRAEVTIKQL